MEPTENLIIIGLYSLLLLLGVWIVYVEVYRRRFRNYATCVFFLAFVTLLLAVPVAIHIAFGGARTIVSEMGHVHDDIYVYLIYALCLTAILVPQFAITLFNYHPAFDRGRLPEDRRQRSWWLLLIYIGVIGVGWYLYVRASGMGLMELMAASRFAWFAERQHSLITGVVADYLIAVSPIFVFNALSGGRRNYWLLAVGLLLLLGYGLCSKDRKWLIYIISGALAAYYVRSGFMIQLRKGVVITFLVLALPLAFWQLFRDTLFGVALGTHTDLKEEAREMFLKVLHVGDGPYYYQASIEAIHQNLSNEVSIPFGVLRRQVFFFLPAKYSLGLKPEDLSAIFSDVVHGGSDLRRGNMPPGFFGLFVLSFHWFCAPLLLAVVPFALRWLDAYVRRNAGVVRDVVVSMTFGSVALWLRGDDSGGGYFVIGNIIVAFFAYGLANFFRTIAVQRRDEGLSVRESSEGERKRLAPGDEGGVDH